MSASGTSALSLTSSSALTASRPPRSVSQQPNRTRYLHLATGGVRPSVEPRLCSGTSVRVTAGKAALQAYSFRIKEAGMATFTAEEVLESARIRLGDAAGSLYRSIALR